MQKQKKVILSLGSNQGNRLEILQKAIDLIHHQIGTVVKTSKLYESPSWGFESDPFYNCALTIHTTLTAQKVLEAILEVETKLGRNRNSKLGYEARPIDIDIISYNNEIHDTDNLQIPHPQIENRKFVLLPLYDLEQQWMHPKTMKSIQILLDDCPDQSSCTVVGEIEPPLKKFNLTNCSYLAIEGNIGSGKTTLSEKIAEDFNAKMVLERFADNPFLPKFYQDHNRYAFPLEMSFLADRYLQIADDLSQFELFKDFVIADYHIFKSLIFAKVTLGTDEYRLYKTLFDIIYREMPKPDLYIYLYQKPERLIQNIKQRGRSYEQEISEDYLDRINQGYLDYIKTQSDINFLIIDVSEIDFVKNQKDYLTILELINSKIGHQTN